MLIRTVHIESGKRRRIGYAPVMFFAIVVCLIRITSGCSSAREEPLPNIVFILADDLGYGDLERYNPGSRIPTPNLNRLADEGMMFTNAHAPASVCTPTRYAILTGRYPWRSRLKQGVLWIWDPPLIEEGRLTIGKMLQQQGYHTACIGKWHLGWEWPTVDDKPASLQNEGRNVDYSQKIGGGPLALGFDYYFGDDVPSFPPHAFIENDRMVVPPDDWNSEGPGAPGAMAPGWTYEALLPAFTEKAEDYIISRTVKHPEQPFFLFFSLSAPHTPIAPEEEFIGKSSAGRYGDFVFQVDHTAGSIMKLLDSLHISENTILIFSSDNGAVPFDGENYTGEFGSIYKYGHYPNGSLRGVKSDAWEGGHRVPFLLKWPGRVKPGQVSNRIISLTDLMATFAILTGYALPDDAAEDSFNLPGLFTGKSSGPTRRSLITQSGDGILSLQDGNWKLIMSSGSGGSWSEPKGNVAVVVTIKGESVWKNIQLYDLENDREEKNNLAAESSEMVNQIANQLTKFVIDGRSTPGPALINNGPAVWNQVSWIKSLSETGNQ